MSYEISTGNGFLLVKLIGECDANNCMNAELEFHSLAVEPVPHFIFNCEHLSSLSKEWYRNLISLQQTLKNSSKALFLVNVNAVVRNSLKKAGIDSTFRICNSQKEALELLGIATKVTLDTNIVNPFLNATLQVLKVQASVTAEAKKIYLKKSSDSGFVGDISGVISIVSDSFNGSVVVSFPEQTFIKIMSSMLGEEYTEISKDILDGAGELTNMIFGQAKVVLNQNGHGINTAIPSVVHGKNHTLTALTKGPTVIIPFSSTAGDFFVEICIAS